MEKKDLILVSRNAREMLVNALYEYVWEHGEEMSDYFYNEHGINDEDEEGVKVVKVLDVSNPGCCFACQNTVNFNSSNSCIESGFHHYSVWSLYIVCDANGNTGLKYYMFHSDGIEYQNSSEPDHDYVDTLSLADLRYIIEAVLGQ